MGKRVTVSRVSDYPLLSCPLLPLTNAFHLPLPSTSQFFFFLGSAVKIDNLFVARPSTTERGMGQRTIYPSEVSMTGRWALDPRAFLGLLSPLTNLFSLENGLSPMPPK